MCLAVPGKIIKLEGTTAEVDIQGVIITADVTLIEYAAVGDWVIVHTGFAVQKYSEEEAMETLRTLNEIAEKAGEA